jgi:hypothetical protein
MTALPVFSMIPRTVRPVIAASVPPAPMAPCRDCGPIRSDRQSPGGSETGVMPSDVGRWRAQRTLRYSHFFWKISRDIRAPTLSVIRQPALVLISIYRGPWLRRASRIRPAGRAAGRRAFFDKTGTSCRKTPRSPWTWRAASGATDGVCFLWATLSLHKQRKVARSRQRAKHRLGGTPSSRLWRSNKQVPRLRLGMTEKDSLT